MDFDRFTQVAEQILSGIPRRFLEGVMVVEAHRRELPHPHLEGVYTLGECADDEAPRLTDPGGLRSRVHLYHGSFRALARQDPSFDWEGELEETILHEIRHHLEDRAGIADLMEEDAEADAVARFRAGEEMSPRWYRGGEKLEPGVYRVADDLFVELVLRTADLERIRGGEFKTTVLDEPLEARIPPDAELGETLTLQGEGLEGADGGYGDLHLVLRER
ncbi:MAG: metallopeptidase family protein [Planctomycetota bacterium]|jgi:hypothetical protein